MRIPGELGEWVQREDGRWERPGYPDDGIIWLREGLSFADYYVTKAIEEDVTPRNLFAEFDALKSRLDELEGKVNG